MAKQNKVPGFHQSRVLSVVQFQMISKEGRCFDGYIRDEKGNYAYVLSKPSYVVTASNKSGTMFDTQIAYTYVILDLQPDGIGCWVWRQRQQHLFFDRQVESNHAAVVNKYGASVSYMQEGSVVEVKNKETGELLESFRVFVGEDRTGYVVDKHGVRLPSDKTIVTEGGTTIFATSDDSLDPSTLYQNYMGTSYVGNRNPKNYDGKTDNYDFKPESPIEWCAYWHDRRYDLAKAKGFAGAVLDTGVLGADRQLVEDAKNSMILGLIYPSRTADNGQIVRETITGIGVIGVFSTISAGKTMIKVAEKGAKANFDQSLRSPMSNIIINK